MLSKDYWFHNIRILCFEMNSFCEIKLWFKTKTRLTYQESRSTNRIQEMCKALFKSLMLLICWLKLKTKVELKRCGFNVLSCDAQNKNQRWEIHNSVKTFHKNNKSWAKTAKCVTKNSKCIYCKYTNILYYILTVKNRNLCL